MTKSHFMHVVSFVRNHVPPRAIVVHCSSRLILISEQMLSDSSYWPQRPASASLSLRDRLPATHTRAKTLDRRGKKPDENPSIQADVGVSTACVPSQDGASFLLSIRSNYDASNCVRRTSPAHIFMPMPGSRDCLMPFELNSSESKKTACRLDGGKSLSSKVAI